MTFAELGATEDNGSGERPVRVSVTTVGHGEVDVRHGNNVEEDMKY